MFRRYLALVSFVLLVPVSAQAMGSGGANAPLLKKTDQEVTKKPEKPIVKDADAPIVKDTTKPLATTPSWLNVDPRALAPIPQAQPFPAVKAAPLTSAVPPSWLNANTLAPIPSGTPLSQVPVPAVSSASLAPTAAAPIVQKPGTEIKKESDEELKKKADEQLSKENKDRIVTVAEKVKSGKELVTDKAIKRGEKAMTEAAKKGLPVSTIGLTIGKQVLKATGGALTLGLDLAQHGAPKSLRDAAVVGLKTATDWAIVATATAAATAVGTPIAGAITGTAVSVALSETNVSGKFWDRMLGTSRYAAD